MKTLILFLKGLIIGLGKIIPGVSGSLLAISLGVYEDAIKKIENIWKAKKEAIWFLLPLGIGIMISILFASNIMLYFLEFYYVYTIIVFIGLIVGTVPGILKKQNMKSHDFLWIGIIVFIFFYLDTHLRLPEFTPQNSFFSFLYIAFLGFIDAVTTVLPGISGTATYMMLGSYNFILNLFANPFSNIFYCFLFGMGLVIGIFLMIKVVNYFFSKKEHFKWVCIIGFLFSSILSLALKVIDYMTSANLFSLILLFIMSYFLISMMTDE